MLTTANPQSISPSPSLAPSPSPSPSLSPPAAAPSPSSSTPLEQLNKIIDILSMSNPTVTVPHSSHNTFFSHNNNNHPPLDPFLFPYHVVPQRLTFSDLLPDKSISVTLNSAGNFSLDDTSTTLFSAMASPFSATLTALHADRGVEIRCGCCSFFLVHPPSLFVAVSFFNNSLHCED